MAIPSILEYGPARFPKFRCMFAWGGDLAVKGGLNGSGQTDAAVAQQVADALYLNSDTNFGQGRLFMGDRSALQADKNLVLPNNTGRFTNGVPIVAPGGPISPYRVFLHFNESTTFNEIRIYCAPDIYNPLFNAPTLKSGILGDFNVKTGVTDTNTVGLYTNVITTTTGNTNPLIILRFASTVTRSIMLEINASYPATRVVRILSMEVYNFVDESSNVKDDNWTITNKREPSTNKFQPTEWSIEFSNNNFGSALGGRYTPKNTSSPIFGKTQADGKGWIRSGTPVEFFGGFVDGLGVVQETQILSGVLGYDVDPAASNGIQMDTTEQTALLSGQDRTGKLTKLLPPENIYTQKPTDQGMSLLLQTANVSPAEMSIDPILLTMPFFVTESVPVWDQVQDIAASYAGVAFFDGAGIFRFKVGTTLRKVVDDSFTDFSYNPTLTNVQLTPNEGFITVGPKNFFFDPTVFPVPFVGAEMIEFNNNGVPSIICINTPNVDANKVRRSAVNLSTGALGAWGDEPNIRSVHPDTTFPFRLISRNNKVVEISNGRASRYAFNGGNAVVELNSTAVPLPTVLSGGGPTALNRTAGAGDIVYHLNWTTLTLWRSTFDDLLTWVNMGQIPDGGNSGWFMGRGVCVNNVLYVFGRGGSGQQARGMAIFLDPAGQNVTSTVDLDMGTINFGGIASTDSQFVYYDGTAFLVFAASKFWFSFIMSNGLLTPWRQQTSLTTGASSMRLAGYPFIPRYTYQLFDTSTTIRYGISFNGTYGFGNLAETGTYTSRIIDGVRLSSYTNWIIRYTSPPVTASTVPGTLTLTLQDSPDAITFTNVAGSVQVLTANTTAEGIITFVPGTPCTRFFRWVLAFTAGGVTNTFTTNFAFVQMIGVQLQIAPLPDPVSIPFSNVINIQDFAPQDGNPRANSIRVKINNYTQNFDRAAMNGVIQSQSVWKVENLNLTIFSGQVVTFNIFLNDFTLPRFNEVGTDISAGYLRYLNLNTSLGQFVATNETAGAGGPAQTFAGIIGVIFGGTSKQVTVILSATGGTYRLDALELTGAVISTASNPNGSISLLDAVAEDSTSIKVYNGKLFLDFSSKYISDLYIAQDLAAYFLARKKDSRYYATGLKVPMVFTPDLLSIISLTNPNAGLTNRDMIITEIIRSGTDWSATLTVEEKFP